MLQKAAFEKLKRKDLHPAKQRISSVKYVHRDPSLSMHVHLNVGKIPLTVA